MATYYLHLHSQPFEAIRLGSKTVESRLHDEKRRKYKVGDKLIFINRSNERQEIRVSILHIHYAPSFDELFLKPSLKGKFNTDSVEELLNGVGKFYSKEDQEKYGVIGVEFIKDTGA